MFVATCIVIGLLRRLGGVVLVLVVGTAAAAADHLPIDRFFGVYEGQSISVTDYGLEKRDLGVTIRPEGRGFNLSWTTVIHTESDDHSRKAYSIDFVPTVKPHVFASAMRRNLFGHRVPLDPMQGDPFVWARITGKTLSVYALIITPDGGYDLQTYDRTLIDDGLRLEFYRIRDGKVGTLVTGFLKRVDD